MANPCGTHIHKVRDAPWRVSTMKYKYTLTSLNNKCVQYRTRVATRVDFDEPGFGFGQPQGIAPTKMNKGFKPLVHFLGYVSEIFTSPVGR
jgi:hypothetical protein